MDLVTDVYRGTAAFPRDEMYGLTNQMRRSAVSVAANLAEGQGRGSNAELTRFARIAHGSLRELETHLLISRRLEYLEEQRASNLLDAAAEVGRLINGLLKSLTRQ